MMEIGSMQSTANRRCRTMRKNKKTQYRTRKRTGRADMRPKKRASISVSPYRAQIKKKLGSLFMRVRRMLYYCRAAKLIRKIRNRLDHYPGRASNTNVRQKLNIIWDVVSIDIVSEMALAITAHLKRVNKTVEGSLSDTHERVEIYRLIKEIQSYSFVDFEHFDEVYRIFVERKRRKLLEDADAIGNKRWEYVLRCKQEGLPHKALQAEDGVKRYVLETYYAYLQDDDGYRQKAFLEFLKKKIEDGDDRKKILDYLENKYKHESYDEYERLTYTPWAIELVDLWVEFFSSGTGYTCMIPRKRPRVVYCRIDKKIPRFIFERPYVEEFTQWEFYRRFTREWEVTNDSPDSSKCDDPFEDPTYYREYSIELEGEFQNAYHQYINAVIHFKSMLKDYGTRMIDMPIQ